MTRTPPRLPTSGSRHGLCPSRSAADGQRHLPPAAAASAAPRRRPPRPPAPVPPPPRPLQRELAQSPALQPAPRPRREGVREGGTPAPGRRDSHGVEGIGRQGALLARLRVEQQVVLAVVPPGAGRRGAALPRGVGLRLAHVAPRLRRPDAQRLPQGAAETTRNRPKRGTAALSPHSAASPSGGRAARRTGSFRAPARGYYVNRCRRPPRQKRGALGMGAVKFAARQLARLSPAGGKGRGLGGRRAPLASPEGLQCTLRAAFAVPPPPPAPARSRRLQADPAPPRLPPPEPQRPATAELAVSGRPGDTVSPALARCSLLSRGVRTCAPKQPKKEGLYSKDNLSRDSAHLQPLCIQHGSRWSEQNRAKLSPRNLAGLQVCSWRLAPAVRKQEQVFFLYFSLEIERVLCLCPFCK